MFPSVVWAGTSRGRTVSVIPDESREGERDIQRERGEGGGAITSDLSSDQEDIVRCAALHALSDWVTGSLRGSHAQVHSLPEQRMWRSSVGELSTPRGVADQKSEKISGFREDEE